MSSIPGNEYFDFEGNGWRPEARLDWARNHQIDPNTGELTGDYPLPPHEFARGYQALHDRAVWNYRRRLMDQGRARFADATNYQRGALGLLQSYRAGGSAALEAGIYNQVAGGLRAQGGADFQQAQMTQPLDLLSDLRRHENVVAQRKADRANERMFIASIVGSAAQNAANGVNASMGSGGGGGGGASVSYGGGGSGGGDGGGNQGGTTYSSTLQGEEYSPDGQDMASPLQQQQPQQESPFTGPGQGGGAGGQAGGGGGGGVETQIEPFGQPGVGAGQVAPAGDQRPGGGQSPTMPATAAPVMGAPGADGNFSSDAFAAASAASNMGSPLADMGRIDLNHFLVDLYESDPFYQSLPLAIQVEWRKRYGGAA